MTVGIVALMENRDKLETRFFLVHEENNLFV